MKGGSGDGLERDIKSCWRCRCFGGGFQNLAAIFGEPGDQAKLQKNSGGG